MKNIDLSIVIVNYKVGKQLLLCLESIKRKIKGVGFEVIVVENGNENLSRALKKFPFVKYIKSASNLGYGGGNNLGASVAQGNFIFILNPDTVIDKGNIKSLLELLKKKKAGVVAPTLADKNGNPFKLQGTQKLSPFRAIFSLSFVNRIWPFNPVSSSFWLRKIKREGNYEVDVVPGTALIIKKDIYNKIGGFDEKFFLFFEESDMCNRVKALGYKIYISSSFLVTHLWGESTKKSKNIQQIFDQSRFYYFRKHYGFILAFITTGILDFNLARFLLFIAVIVGAFLRLDRPGLSMFIQDQGWFYLSAKNLIVYGQIPLVGITSSHTWLHQGAFWTYLLAPFLSLFDFNPFAGFFLATLFGIGSIVLIYKVGKRAINSSFGVIAALIYSVSPLIVIHERMSYHTAPISFFTLLLIYSLLRWVKGNIYFFPISLMLMSVLYNLELATIVFWPIIFFTLLGGYIKKKRWVVDLINPRMILISIILFLIPMIPILVYDLSHNFVQTVKYAGWLVYMPISSFLKGGSGSYKDLFYFINLHLERLVFLPNVALSYIIFVISIFVLCLAVINENSRTLRVILLAALIPVAAFIVGKTPSEAYLPMLFPGIILSISFLIYQVFLGNKYIAIIFISIFISINGYLIYTNNYLMEKPYGYGLPIYKRIDAAKQIITYSKGKPYNLKYESSVPQITYSTENYEYLTWWLGNPPTKNNSHTHITVFENEHSIKVSVSK